MSAPKEPQPVTLPGYAVRDLRDYLNRVAATDDDTAACRLLHQMAGYLRHCLTHPAPGDQS